MWKAVLTAASCPGGGGHPQKGALQPFHHTFCIGIAPAPNCKISQPSITLFANYEEIERDKKERRNVGILSVALFPHTP